MKKSVSAKRSRLRSKKATSVGSTTPSERRKIQVAAVTGKLIENPSMSVGNAAREAGLSEYIAVNPRVLTQSVEWADALEQYLPQGELLSTHKGLLKASRIDHMTFISEQSDFTDTDIKTMFEELNCTVRKIIHRDTGARDVYFWSPDNKARATALDLAYKLRGSYAVDKAHVAFSLASLAKLRIEGGSTPELSAPPPPVDGFSMPRAAV